MLKMKDLIENFDLAKTILAHWEYDKDTVDTCFEYFRISSNAVYPFKRDGRLCFLRFAPISEKLLTNIRGEIEFIEYLRENGYPAMEPIRAENGEYVLTVNSAWGDYYATAFLGVDGEEIEETDFSDKVCFAYGKALGKLHALSSSYTPTVEKQSYEDLLSLIEKRLDKFHCDRKLFDVLVNLRSKLTELPKNKKYYGLVHYDFECDNVFYDEVTDSCNVIDFDDSIYHFYALDIEQAVDSICEEAPEEMRDSAVNAFIAGYKTEFGYDEETEKMRSVMRLFCDLYSYTKLLYCLSESVNDKPEWMDALESKLKRKAEYLKRKLCSV